MSTARWLDRALKNAGVSITGVSIGDSANKATWKVSPANLQAAAQPTIDAFDPNDPAHVQADTVATRDRELAAKVMRALATAVHKRFKAQIATDTTTAAQWEAAIRAEWDAL